MCILSDYYQPMFPDFNLDEFKQAVEAAKFIDTVTKQPDCEDPEKAKLIEKVASRKNKRRR